MTADGNWNLVVSTPMRQATLSVKTEGTTLKGSQAANGNSTEIFDGTVNGDEISWKVSITDPMPMTPEFNGTIKGDDVTGGVVLGDFARHSLVRAANHASMLSRRIPLCCLQRSFYRARLMSRLPTLVYTVVFSQIDTQIFSRWQFLIGRAGKTFIWINTKCLKIEIKNPVATIPNGEVPCRGCYPPRPICAS